MISSSFSSIFTVDSNAMVEEAEPVILLVESDFPNSVELSFLSSLSLLLPPVAESDVLSVTSASLFSSLIIQTRYKSLTFF